MQLLFEHFTIELINESSYDVSSYDNSNSYQHHHFAEERKNCTNCHGIIVTETECEFNAVVLADGGSTGIHSNCATIHANQLLICCGDYVFCLTLPTLELKWKVKADLATTFEIRPINDGFIVHGELEISRIDNSGSIAWQQGGEDIFVNSDGTDNFELTPEGIQVTDWSNKIYSFDLNGNLLN